MASLNFYLEKRKTGARLSRTENLPILLYFSYDGKRLQYYTGERSDLKYWDIKQQRIYPSHGGRQINDFLNYLEGKVWELYRMAKASGIRPGNEYFRNALRKGNNRSSYDFFDVLIQYIEEKQKIWSITTFREVRSFYNHLRAFSEVCGYTLSFEKINKVFLEALIGYFTGAMAHSNSTCRKNIMILKGFLKWAEGKGYHHNNQYLSFRFPWTYGQRYYPSPLALEREELLQFMEYKFEDHRLRQVRDIFCFMCFTGLTYREVYSLKRESVSEDWLYLSSTGKKIIRSIPLNSHALKILSECTGRQEQKERFFPGFSNVTMNYLLKKAAEKAGLDKPVQVIIYSGTDERRRQIPKWKAMSGRLALHTFIMTAFESGINTHMVREFTGYRSLAGIRKYESAFMEMKQAEMKRFERMLDHSSTERGR